MNPDLTKRIARLTLVTGLWLLAYGERRCPDVRGSPAGTGSRRNSHRIHFGQSAAHSPWQFCFEARAYSTGSGQRKGPVENSSWMPQAVRVAARAAIAGCTRRSWIVSTIRSLTFIPDRVDGKIDFSGTSEVQLHGMLKIHGTTHEVVLPVKTQMAQGQMTATGTLTVPYVSWGMKNPSTLFLRVNESVDVVIRAVGHLTTSAWT